MNNFLVAEGYLENLSWAEVKLQAKKIFEANGFMVDSIDDLYLKGYYTELQGAFYAPWADPECPQYNEYLCFKAGRRWRHDSKFICFIDFYNTSSGMWETKELTSDQEELIYKTLKQIYDDLYIDRPECCAYDGWHPYLAD